MPAGVEQICVMHGGTEWEDFTEKRTHGILTESSGLACVVLRNLYHLVIDLRRTLWDGDTFFLNTNDSSPTDVEFFENKYSSPSRQHSDRGRHLAYNLMNTGQSIVNDTKEYHPNYKIKTFTLISRYRRIHQIQSRRV